jgi:DNA-binding HxlR family transcriptional regulator
MTPEYIDFFKRRKALVYYFLEASIIRGSDEVKNIDHGAHYIYKEHFLKGQLVGRYSQEKIGEFLGTSQSRVSKSLKELENDGFIKRIIRTTHKTNILYYQFGTWEGEYGKDTYKEIIWLDEFFVKKYRDAKKSKVEKNKRESAIALMDFYDNWVDYEILMESISEDELDDLRVLWNEKKRSKEYAI